MKLTRNFFTIADLITWLKEKSLVVNKKYQRGRGLWPINSRSFFIDTIINGYPFPKITLRQTIDLRTKQSIREIIDGQQRMMTINDFMEDNLTLTAVSNQFKGKTFSDLDDQTKENFLAYEVSVDTVIGETEEEVLQIFRRMNSYTLPLNEPEKRHAIYQGEFKWFIKELLDAYAPVFEKYKILTVREMSRMMDADLMTELCQVLMVGIKGRSAKQLEKLYKDNDREFREKNNVEARLKETLDFIKVELTELCSDEVLMSYSFYSLFSALVYNKWGIINIRDIELDGLNVIGKYTPNINKSIQNILEMFMALDQKDYLGKFGNFVVASTSTTHSLKNRMIRLKSFVDALQDRL